MGQKKNSKIILIVIILLVILILLAGGAYAYFATDIFKSDKKLFFKYIVQMADEKEGFIETNLKEYFEKQKNTPYTNQGTISVNIKDSNNQQQYENTNNMNISFEGKVDGANSNFAQDISINYTDSIKFPFSVRKVGDIAGIQTKYIGSKYIALNLKEAKETEESFKKIEELTNIELSQEDKQHIQDVYFKVISEQLQDSKFSKIKDQNSKGYKLTVTVEDLKNLLIKLLETLKDDQVVLNKINEYIKDYGDSYDITKRDIEDLIEEINTDIADDSEYKDINIEITVYQEKQKTTKLLLNINNSATIRIEKNITGNSQQYNILSDINIEEMGSMKINFGANYSGIQSLQSIGENYEFTTQYEEKESENAGTASYQYNISNQVDFTDNITIDDFSDNNSMLLNNYDEDKVANFMKAVEERLKETNKKQMQQLGVEEYENPIIYAIPSLELMIYSQAMNVINQTNMQTNLDEALINTYNEKFELYAGTNIMGATVKGLMSTISNNNVLADNNEQSKDLKIKEIHFDAQEYEASEQNITLIKTSIETDKYYRVEFERDENTGIIYRVVINEK